MSQVMGANVDERDFFRNAQGMAIFTRHWLPQQPPRSLVFLFHGVAEHCGRYDEVASHLASQGFAVFSLDHQGHGRSEGVRAHVEQFNDYANDAVQYMSLVLFEGRFHDLNRETIAKTLPKYVLGHSMGTLVAALVSYRVEQLCGLIAVHGETAVNKSTQWEETSASWKGLVLSGPAIVPDPKAAPPILIAVVKLVSKIAPKFAAVKLDAAGICSDPKVVEAYRQDPLVYTGPLRARWLVAMMDAMHTAVNIAPSLTWPLLVLQGAEDPICLPAGAQKFYSLYTHTDKQLIEYPAMRHEVFNEIHKDKVFGDLVDWLGTHL
eukprot:c12310_g1_i2.p1 GENE.c12310_g1_i2~~c12310_g1_i2.p1  ORF type:complete len:332 (+),score=70.42 c12310_g1_i2:36-998(+)